MSDFDRILLKANESLGRCKGFFLFAIEDGGIRITQGFDTSREVKISEALSLCTAVREKLDSYSAELVPAIIKELSDD